MYYSRGIDKLKKGNKQMTYEIREMRVSDAKSIIEHKQIVTDENPDTLATAIENRPTQLVKKKKRLNLG